MHVIKDLPQDLTTRVVVKTLEDGTQVVFDDQGEKLLSFSQVDPKITRGTGKRGRAVAWVHPTRANHEESKARRQMARRSRKKNRRK